MYIEIVYVHTGSVSVMSVFHIPHEKLLSIQRVSNPSTGNQRKSTPAQPIVVHIGMYVSSELMVQIKQKSVYGVEIPPPRSFLGGIEVVEVLCKFFVYIEVVEVLCK